MNGYPFLYSMKKELCHQGSVFLSVVSSSNRAQPLFLRLAEVLEMTGMGKTQGSEGRCQESGR